MDSEYLESLEEKFEKWEEMEVKARVNLSSSREEARGRKSRYSSREKRRKIRQKDALH